MKSLLYTFSVFICILLNVLTGHAFFFSDTTNVIEIVHHINNMPFLTWESGLNGLNGAVKISDLKSRYVALAKKGKEPTEMLFGAGNIPPDDDLPKNYDSRIVYPYCTTISSIKDQSNCGSCWAVSTASAFSDRLCIHSEGKINYNMSAEQLVACDLNGLGCIGGSLEYAWWYIKRYGLVTGGDYGSNEGCWPYSFPPGNSDILGWLLASRPRTPDCREVKCSHVYKATTYRRILNNEYNIRREIYTNGPVTAWFDFYLSIYFYRQGIYQPLENDYLLGAFGHAIRIIGWGEENGVKYWIVSNSWSREWGENGILRILRGSNCCHIESWVVAGMPEV